MPNSTSNTEARAREAFIRWQKITLTQLGYVVNLLLTLTTGALGYTVNLMVERKIALTAPAERCLFASTVLLLLAMASGLLTNWSRLNDFRFSARAARGRELHERAATGAQLTPAQQSRAAARVKSKEKAECYGRWTWRLLAAQLVSFLAGALLLAVGIALGVRIG